MKNVITEIYPHAKYQPCVVHVMTNFLAKVRVQHRNIIATEIKEVFHAKDKKEAEQLFMKFIQKWKNIYPNLMNKLLTIREDIFTYMELPDY